MDFVLYAVLIFTNPLNGSCVHDIWSFLKGYFVSTGTGISSGFAGAIRFVFPFFFFLLAVRTFVKVLSVQ